MNHNYEKIKKLINSDEVGPIFFVTPNPNRAVGLEKEIKNYHIICSQKSDIIDYLEKDGVSVFCLDKSDIINSGKILGNKNAIEYIKDKSKEKKPNVITFKPSPKIAKICLDNGFGYLGNNWQINRKLENKTEFAKINSALGVSNAESKVIKLEENLKFKDLFGGEKTVFQLSRGFSGNSTFMVSEEEEFRKIVSRFEGREVKISKFIEGETYTINAYIGSFGFALSQPILQLTGLTSFNKNIFGTSGNDYYFAKNLGGKEKRKIFDYTRKIGEYAKDFGYRGIFGLDFIVGASGEVDLIEINPRFIGSIPVFTKLQIANDQIPFLAWHICDYLKISTRISFNINQNYSSWLKEENFKASQIILRNITENSLEVEKSIISGIYKIKDEKLLLKNKTYCMERELGEDELFIQCVSQGSTINPDIEYANIQAGYGIMETSSEIKKTFQEKANLILEQIRFQK